MSSPGDYTVAVTWSPHPNRATNAPFTIFDGIGGQALETVLLNQELAPDDFIDNGSRWEDLAVVAISGSELVVELTNAATQYVIADAIRIAPTKEEPLQSKKWHKVTLTFDGPQTSETADPNPFTDFRLDVTFTHLGTGKSYLVPGYYASDGDAANTGATSGNKWRVHFAPSETGQWTWMASFRTAAMLLDHLGEAAAACRVRRAVAAFRALEAGLTPDIGGNGTTAGTAQRLVNCVEDGN